jgi:hypothetical protein
MFGNQDFGVKNIFGTTAVQLFNNSPLSYRPITKGHIPYPINTRLVKESTRTVAEEQTPSLALQRAPACQHDARA